MKTLTLREIDVLIEKHIFGSEVTTWNTHFTRNKRQEDIPIVLIENGEYHGVVPDYSKEIEDAWLVVEKIQEKEKLNFELQRRGADGSFFVNFIAYGASGEPHKMFWDAGKSAPLAICLIALKTQGIEVQIDANDI